MRKRYNLFIHSLDKKCRNICSLYTFQNSRPLTSGEQLICKTCNKQLLPAGVEAMGGRRYCKCCNNMITSYESNDPYKFATNQYDEKKWIPGIQKEVSDKKTFDDLKNFIEEGMRLQANYQLVMLKYLVSHKIAHIGEIAEELAYYNNCNYSDIEVVKKFFNVPVYDVLVKRGFVKTETPYYITQYILNVNLNEYEEIEINELLEKKLEEYNKQHNIPQNDLEESLEISWYEYEDLLTKHRVIRTDPARRIKNGKH